ncbi:hypothetical protein BDN72DRAFT_806316 [Pluteus cervinus]|uniref:Uncharacterized protein n=1 Tax=Pluteus cervinus TaxID=181527 RepID=A0ACD2ZZN9_9AGAR|nr:hypothetical protein BDN72DRAFT_806316 [Pluteus cervinus]
MSSPVVGTQAERAAHRIRKGQKQRMRTNAMKAEQTAQEAAKQQKEDWIDVLDYMNTCNVRLGDLLKFVSDPVNGEKQRRWDDIFLEKDQLEDVLDLWAHKSPKTVRQRVCDWAVKYVASLVSKEARRITRRKDIQTAHCVVNQDLIMGFNILDFFATFNKVDSAPVSLQILSALATSPYASTHSEARKTRTKLVITSTLLTCLGEYSRRNNLVKRIIGLYLYATGSQRQVITVLSSLGLSESYSNLVTPNIRQSYRITAPQPDGSKQPTDLPPDPYRYTGTIRQLAVSMQQKAQELAATFVYGSVYDNINIQVQVPEQTVLNHASQENGTCATIFPLFKANLDDMKTSDFQKAFFEAPPLRLDHIIHSKEEAATFRQNLIFTMLRTIINFGGEGFHRFEGELNQRQPASKAKIEVHKTELYPLPTWNIDESTIIGNAEVDKAIITALGLDKVPNFWEHVRFQGGDQLSIARLRALEIIRAGQEEGYDAFFWGAWMPGLFHAKMADILGLLLIHWGKPNAGTRNPGSLAFHNTCLDRLPITITSPPNFRICRDLIFVSLYARILHCLLRVSGFATLEEYTDKVKSWSMLYNHVEKLYDQFLNISTVDDLRWKRKEEVRSQESDSDHDSADEGEDGPPKPPLTQGDMVYEGAVLFLRDALISREFTEAIKAGDSGRVYLVLKKMCLSFRGSGRVKYAHELLHLIHHLEYVWPKPIREIVLNNWLLNPTGKPNSFVEIDLVQEHLNYWIKVFYKAHGSTASWDWLELVSPCVNALRHLASGLNDILGAQQGTRHAPPDLSNDIRVLMESLNEHGVYEIKLGRVLDKDDLPTKNIAAEGAQALFDTNKSPLNEYNEAFARLQRRRKITPISQTRTTAPTPATASACLPPHHSSTPSPNPDQSGNSCEDESEPLDADDVLEADPADLELESDLDEANLEIPEVELTLELQSAADVALDMDLVDIPDDFNLDEGDSSETESEGGGAETSDVDSEAGELEYD